ncbi:hypothetical protein [Roseateles saccharophilus]|uniref:hypothetical protein n=1 Tax=Roseateles saccharophilus TaxID=304 RepID=UPI00104727E6|nr:hypothetical protein [Roseateles saccharophilus]MDG0836242.1 hypothetical protein [Roseateles saccharophilus]
MFIDTLHLFLQIELPLTPQPPDSSTFGGPVTASTAQNSAKVLAQRAWKLAFLYRKNVRVDLEALRTRAQSAFEAARQAQ